MGGVISSIMYLLRFGYAFGKYLCEEAGLCVKVDIVNPMQDAYMLFRGHSTMEQQALDAKLLNIHPESPYWFEQAEKCRTRECQVEIAR